MFDHDIMVEHVPDHDIMVERVLHHFRFIPNHDNTVEHGQKIVPQNNMVRTRLNMVKHVWQCLTMISWSAGKQGYNLFDFCNIRIMSLKRMSSSPIPIFLPMTFQVVTYWMSLSLTIKVKWHGQRSFSYIWPHNSGTM